MGQVIQLIDSYTKENVNYEETAVWHDGTQMDDSKVDNVIYRKKGTTYYVDASFQNGEPVNIQRFGIKANANYRDGNNWYQDASKLKPADDDTALINRANNILSARGATLLFPRGNYYISGYVAAKTSWMGEDGATIVANNTTGDTIQIVSGNTSFKKIIFDGRAPTCFQVKANDVLFEDLTFKNLGQNVLLFNCENIRIFKCAFESTGYGIIQQAGYVSNHVIIEGCIANNIKSDFIEANCTSSAVSKNWIISDNIVKGTDGYPTTATEKRAVGITAVENVLINSNIFERISGDSAIHLEDVRGNCVIDGNIIKDCRGTGYIYVMHIDKNVVISNNILHRSEADNNTPFVFAASGGINNDWVISGNQFIANPAQTGNCFSFGYTAGHKIISNNHFSGFNTFWNILNIGNVSFTSNYISAVEGIILKNYSVGSATNWLISDNWFNTTGDSIFLTMNTNGTGFPERFKITDNRFAGNVVLSSSKNCDVSNNLFNAGKTLTVSGSTVRISTSCNKIIDSGYNSTDNLRLVANIAMPVDSVAADVAALKNDFNALLAKLRQSINHTL